MVSSMPDSGDWSERKCALPYNDDDRSVVVVVVCSWWWYLYTQVYNVGVGHKCGIHVGLGQF